MEVLVVMFIIGLVSSIVITSLPGREPVVREEAARLERTLDTLAARAVLTGTIYALDVSTNDYQALQWMEGDWTPVRDGRHQVPDAVTLFVDGDPTEDEIWRFTLDPAGLPLRASIELRGQRETVEIRRVRQDIGRRR